MQAVLHGQAIHRVRDNNRILEMAACRYCTFHAGLVRTKNTQMHPLSGLNTVVPLAIIPVLSRRNWSFV